LSAELNLLRAEKMLRQFSGPGDSVRGLKARLIFVTAIWTGVRFSRTKYATVDWSCDVTADHATLECLFSTVSNETEMRKRTHTHWDFMVD